ncbi:MAG TPA: hypothetical protein VFP92_10745 [Rhodanobacteraceae bacterium]|nr:hypothetical protein [Rhodanobacteraceae bacterium]
MIRGTLCCVIAFIALAAALTSMVLCALISQPDPTTAPRTPTCYTFHRAVVIVPAVCAKHDICETAIEAKVCDSILIQGAKR